MGGGVALDAVAFRAVTREVCDLPTFFTPLLMHRIHATNPIAHNPDDPSAAPGSPTAPAVPPHPVTLQQFTAYW